MREWIQDADIVLTTALIPGRPAPLLVTEEMVQSMQSGSVIVDMAAGTGAAGAGNVAISRPDEIVISSNGVKVRKWLIKKLDRRIVSTVDATSTFQQDLSLRS
jgi:NAD/NADP transhydrogenase alpha subunit